MEIVSSMVVEFGKCWFAAAGDQLGYLFHYNYNVENLKNQAKKLADSRDMVQKKIKFAEGQGEIIFANVQSWIAEVDNIYAKAESFLEGEEKANKRCLKGWCINLGQCYQFSKEAKKQTLAISDQLREVAKIESVSIPARPSGIISSSEVSSSGSFESRNSIKKKIVKALVDDDGVYIIGICGMGGVGKTTLVREMGKQLKDDKTYDEVVMAVVSQTPSIMRIQGEIADMLGVTTSLPANSEIERAGFLWNRIKERKRILVILDDVWGDIKLDAIGIPFGAHHRDCKIVITSPSTNICDQMNCQKKFIVETLSKQESWALFKELAGTIVETSDINSIARDVAAKCGGLPIAIETVAGALKGKDKDAWSNARRQLQKSNPTSIQGMGRKVFSSLEPSFNCLENVESQSLFLFCSLFPEDYRISLEDLVRYWIGLRWFGDTDEPTEAARERVHDIVSTITSYFLLIDDGEKYVKMHVVVRDFAIIKASKCNHKFMVKAGIGLKEWPNIDSFEDFTCISLMANYIWELPSGLKYPKLQALLLQKNFQLVVPNNFFQDMKDLSILDLSNTKLLSLPESLTFLSTIRALNLSGCTLGDLSMIENLSKLEILSLSKSSINEVPVSFSQLTNLKLLDLNNCWELTLIPYGVICSLKNLEELYVNRYRQWEYENSNANLVESSALSRLTHLEISISNLDLSPKLLVFSNNLSKFKIRIGYIEYSDNDLDESRYARNMCVSKTNILKIHDWVKSLLKRTEWLSLEKIVNLESISHNLVEEGFNELKYLDITSCDEIKYLLNAMEWTPNSTFYNLEELRMVNNPNLVELCHGQPPTQPLDHNITSPILGNLTSMLINECPELKNLFTPSIVKCLVKLKSLQLWYCSTIQEIVTNEKGEKEASIERIVFPSLYYLQLGSLNNLTCFSSGSYTIEYPALESLEISGCGKLKTFGYKEQVTPKLNKVLVERYEERWNGNLNATVQEYFNEQSHLRGGSA